MPKVLMIAFHYPPFEGGSGVHRTLKFSRYLPENGWQPIVLTANPRAYPKTGVQQLAEIPQNVVVRRAFACDTARHLSVGGRYLRSMALPDQWVSWWCGAVISGLSLIKRYKPSVIWSTYPIATAHLIGLTLKRLTGLPWIADFRDSMTEDHYPRDVWTRRTYLWIERRAVKHAARFVFTASSTRQMYLTRYPALKSENCILIPNGFDDDDFDGINSEPSASCHARPVRLLHAGLIYTDDRDPRAFFRAIARLKKEGRVNARELIVDLRASGSEAYYGKLLAELNIDDIVRLLPPLPYREALNDCADADALIILQAGSCDHQIPAKAYEYLRLRKPILALTTSAGDTSALLVQVGGATIIDLADEDEIYRRLPSFIDAVRAKRHELPDPAMVKRFSRKHQTLELSNCLHQMAPES